jgi:hypothetical protein
MTAHLPKRISKFLGVSLCGYIVQLATVTKGWQHPLTLQRRHIFVDNASCRRGVSKTKLHYSHEDEMEYLPKLFSVAEHWEGAGTPRPELPPEEIPSLLMKSLELNDFPNDDSGLYSLWDFSSGMLRQSCQQNVTAFIEAAHQDADYIPTSFYGMALNGKSWEVETTLNRVGGENGYLATQIVKTVSDDGRMRRWQFMLRKNRRPPHLNCWFVESIGASDRTGNFQVED